MAVMIAVPLMQLLLFGFAVSTTVEHIPTVVYDASLDSASYRYVDALVTSGFFDVVGYAATADEMIATIDRGDAQVGVQLPARFYERQARGDAQALILVDGSDMFTSRSAYDAATAVAQMHSVTVLQQQLSARGLVGRVNLMPLDARIRILYNPNLTDLFFVLPGMLAMIMQSQTMAMTASAVVREKEHGTIEQLLVTPIRAGELMVGKIAPNVIVGLLNVLTILGLGVYGFHMPFRGSFLLFLELALIYIASGLALGLLLSTISRNQNQTIQLVMVFSLLGVVLSGFMFPREGMPPVLRWLSYAFPLTHFIPVSRGVLLKGAGIDLLGPNIFALVAYVVAVITLTSLAFRQRLD